MKRMFLMLTLLISPLTMASYGTGGAPSVPCYIDGKYKGTIAINECKRLGGEIPGEKKSKQTK
ncbi:hypothetical protein [Vibrio breoganii]|uniref:hypothetical protein n=1 Tax=Vibrio breoganii TaxID=553239 RepID=UPI00030A4A51|nr:hypothetical protein [Vibrio breoganii]OED96559.1 hypothetical protein A1QG_14935 [Vibrio breoganii ZF-29]PMH15916.1 hypothetical protein BCU74_13195 [Vibrio breoganii]PMK54560.1 hypothetical protein BCT98_01860 [Vibrio breoganii]PMK67955.1 hypothetical protein BCT94_02775 [Vibrio breoganii]PMM15369.1 hypothetical protein BCT60_07470 [Vibrio breoganii]